MPEAEPAGAEAAAAAADPGEAGQRLAEVVHLPTAGRPAGTVRGELRGE